MNDNLSAGCGLARALSKMGYCSRSKAVAAIRAGRVSVNGRVQHDPESRVHIGRDRIVADGTAVQSVKKIYVALNKPRGLVTTTADEKGRDTVYACLAGHGLPWLSPVGRLDKASEGLLLFSNDSEWADRLLSPDSHLEKVYHVQIDRLADDELLRRMRDGVERDGERLAVRHVSVLRCGKRHCWLEFSLDEGRNRQIRRIMDVLGVEVLRLVRIAIGPVPLGDLAKGAFRNLTALELTAIDRALLASSPRAASHVDLLREERAPYGENRRMQRMSRTAHPSRKR